MILFIFVTVVALLLFHELTKKDIEGPKALTDLFAPQIKLKRRKPFPKAFKEEAVRYAQEHGVTKTVERYDYLGLTRGDVHRWMRTQ